MNRPLVGVGVMLVHEGKVLFGKRKNAHGEGCWSFPGGHLEFNETVEDCAAREVREETGLEIRDVQHLTFTNDFFDVEGKHYVTLFVRAEPLSGDPQNLEPEKCEGWEWRSWDALPQPLFKPIQNLLKEDLDLQF